MKITLGAAPLGIREVMEFGGDNITLVPAAFDGWGNGPIPKFPPLGIYRHAYTRVYALDVTNSGKFAIIRIVNDEAVMLPIEDEPFELHYGDAIVFGSQPEVFILWVQSIDLLACCTREKYGVIPYEEWVAIFGDP